MNNERLIIITPENIIFMLVFLFRRSVNDHMSCESHSDLENQDEKSILEIDSNAKDMNNERSSSITNGIHQ